MKPSEIIKQGGWVQRYPMGNKEAQLITTPLEESGGYCASAAIMKAAFSIEGASIEEMADKRDAWISKVVSLLSPREQQQKNPLISWNDSSSTHKEGVIEKLERAGL